MLPGAAWRRAAAAYWRVSRLPASFVFFSCAAWPPVRRGGAHFHHNFNRFFVSPTRTQYMWRAAGGVLPPAAPRHRHRLLWLRPHAWVCLPHACHALFPRAPCAAPAPDALATAVRLCSVWSAWRCVAGSTGVCPTATTPGVDRLLYTLSAAPLLVLPHFGFISVCSVSHDGPGRPGFVVMTTCHGGQQCVCLLPLSMWRVCHPGGVL